MGFVSTAKDGSGKTYYQLSDPDGRTSVIGPTGIVSRFRFLAGSSGVNPILPAPGADHRYKIAMMQLQNQSGASVTGIVQGLSDIAGFYMPQFSASQTNIVTVVNDAMAPLTLNLNEPLQLALTDSRLVSGWGTYWTDDY